MQRPLGLMVIAGLSLAQGIFGILQGLHWFKFGTDIAGYGVLILPLIGVIAFARGGLVVVLAMAYLAFTLGALARQAWAWWLGLIMSLGTLVIVAVLITREESRAEELLWAVVPVMLLCYLLAPAGRRALQAHV
jgi:hypothetical protein